MTFDPEQYKNVERQAYSMGAASYEEYGGEMFRAYAKPLVDGAGLKPGQHVLDVACGPGTASLLAAPVVAPDGDVVGVNLAPGMVELARKKAEEAHLTNVTFREADAEHLPFQDYSFDLVVSSHGLVHTTNRVKALHEMWRVLKKGGSIAVSVWSTPERSVAISIVAKIIRERFPAAIVPGAPMWFDFGSEGTLEQALSDAGFCAVRVGRHTMVRHMRNGERYWEGILGISGRLQMLLQNIPSDIASNIKIDVVTAAEKFRAGEVLSIPCEEVMAWGNK
jgi:ubiquinone/menaquinone biosynthesis C-methylase UbiE